MLLRVYIVCTCCICFSNLFCVIALLLRFQMLLYAHHIEKEEVVAAKLFHEVLFAGP